jgi:hypothetical protein
MVVSSSSFFSASFSIFRIFEVKTALTNATIKYIKNIRVSSAFLIAKVNFGGMKKKFQVSALMTAAVKTGPILKNMAINETVTSKISATTL